MFFHYDILDLFFELSLLTDTILIFVYCRVLHIIVCCEYLILRGSYLAPILFFITYWPPTSDPLFIMLALFLYFEGWNLLFQFLDIFSVGFITCQLFWVGQGALAPMERVAKYEKYTAKLKNGLKMKIEEICRKVKKGIWLMS